MAMLEDEIRQTIALEGPMSIERYMHLALMHPVYGYYVTRDPFGAQGDFITAPEISQMFGELLGLWAAEVWALMGAPARVNLVELGPGRGVLMADALRAARVVEGFEAAIRVHLVEASPVLAQIQRETLTDHLDVVSWCGSIDDLPEEPTIIIANEFFDALPVRQYVATPEGWRERLIGLDADQRLQFGLAPDPEPLIVAQAPEGSVLEVGFAAHDLMGAIAARLATWGGAMAVIDYGHVATGPGETLQAVRAHARADPLEAPGEADLTAHVDFAMLTRAAQGAGATVLGPTTQADFLTSLGIFQRAAGLKRNATVRQAIDIDRALLRLVSTDEEPGAGGAPAPAMGALFKVLGVAGAGLETLPGFTPRDLDAPESAHDDQ